jgi:hypothetical protein
MNKTYVKIKLYREDQVEAIFIYKINTTRITLQICLSLKWIKDKKM